MSDLVKNSKDRFSHDAARIEKKIYFQLKALMTKCDEKDIEIRNIHAEVERNNEKIHVLQTDIGNENEMPKIDNYNWAKI